MARQRQATRSRRLASPRAARAPYHKNRIEQFRPDGSALSKMDVSTKSRAVHYLQSTAGNTAVQRMMAPQVASVNEIDRMNSESAGTVLAKAGKPEAEAPPDGVQTITDKKAGEPNSFGLTGGLTRIFSGSAFESPSFEVDVSEKTKGDSAQYFAQVQPTKSPDAVHESFYPAPGIHTRQLPGGVQVLYISNGVSNLIRKGEQEHLNDASRAYNLTYGLITKTINALSKKALGPAEDEDGAERLAEAIFQKMLAQALKKAGQPQGALSDPSSWSQKLEDLIGKTLKRDTGHWHDVIYSPYRPQGKPKFHEVDGVQHEVMEVGPTGSTKIGKVKSKEIVKF